MSDKELARDILVAMLGNCSYYDEDTAEIVAKSYEIIYNKIHSLDK